MNEIRAKEEGYNYVRVGAVSVVIPVLVQLGFLVQHCRAGSTVSAGREPPGKNASWSQL